MMNEPDRRYTHIIVGAGSAGCLLANRLSSQAQNSVLLIEAGAWDDGFWLKLPVGYYKTMNNPKVSRHFASEPSEGSGWPLNQLAARARDWGIQCYQWPDIHSRTTKEF
jgi:choline dehydrogenase-like flavoprotein